MKPVSITSAAVAAALALSACGGKPSAVIPRQNNASLPYSTANGGSVPSQDPRDLPVPQIDGKPLWAANRKHTAEENAEYQFAKNGGDFGAKSETDYVTRAHAFVESPPGDVETIDRANGDKLMYDVKGNVFAVVARGGAPRTMFKPKGGATYWAEQKQRETKRTQGSQDGGSDQS